MTTGKAMKMKIGLKIRLKWAYLSKSLSRPYERLIQCRTFMPKPLFVLVVDIFENDSSTKIKTEVAQEALERQKIRDKIIQEEGLAQDLAPLAPFL